MVLVTMREIRTIILVTKIVNFEMSGFMRKGTVHSSAEGNGGSVYR